MMRTPDPDFERRLAEFNDGQGGPSRIAVAWHPRLERWQVFAIPVGDSTHPLARNEVTQKLCRPLPDDSGRSGILLFTWCERNRALNDIGFKPLDERLFETLHWADSFTDKHHFETAIEEPGAAAERERSRNLRNAVGAASEYWAGLDRLVISMNPAVRVPGDWRARQYWR